MFSPKLPQNRHGERSTSQICRVRQRWVRGVEEPVPSVAERTLAELILPMPRGLNTSQLFKLTGHIVRCVALCIRLDIFFPLQW